MVPVEKGTNSLKLIEAELHWKQDGTGVWLRGLSDIGYKVPSPWDPYTRIPNPEQQSLEEEPV